MSSFLGGGGGGSSGGGTITAGTPPIWNGDTGTAGTAIIDPTTGILYIAYAVNSWSEFIGLTIFGSEPLADDTGAHRLTDDTGTTILTKDTNP